MQSVLLLGQRCGAQANGIHSTEVTIGLRNFLLMLFYHLYINITIVQILFYFVLILSFMHSYLTI